MNPQAGAVAVSIGVTGLVAVLGALALIRAAERRPSIAALGAPIVVVASLAAGVAAATRSMLVAKDDYRTLLFVLLAGAPMALLVCMVLARRVQRWERRAARESAERQRVAEVEASRRDTIGWLSHDLRTPITGIRLLAEGLADRHAEDAGTSADLNRLVREVDRVDALVGDIAEMSRLQGPGPRVRSAVDLTDVLSDAVAAVSAEAEAAKVSIIAGAVTGATVLGDVRALTRAVTNLVRNAVQHTPAGEQVLVSVEGTRVDVEDRCGGIQEEDLDHLTEAGWRGDSARSRSGAGFGLAIAAAVARDHDGELTVTNLANGNGCLARLSVGRESIAPIAQVTPFVPGHPL